MAVKGPGRPVLRGDPGDQRVYYPTSGQYYMPGSFPGFANNTPVSPPAAWPANTNHPLGGLGPQQWGSDGYSLGGMSTLSGRGSFSPAGSGQFPGCLLYTSDAADE